MSGGSIFILSGERLTFPQAEIRALVEAYSPKDSTEPLSSRVVYSSLSDPTLIEKIVSRAAYCRFGGAFVSKSNAKEEITSSIDFLNTIGPGKTFAVASETLEREERGEMGARIKSMTRSKVSLECPDLLFQAERIDSGYVLGVSRNGYKKTNWRDRRPRARNFFLPSAIYPKLAALLVNLSRAKEGELFLDPFCGTGSLLIEAAVMGIRSVGIDLVRWVARGALSNLKGMSFAGYSTILRADSTRSFPLTRVDAVATDVPYGRAASTRGKDTNRIINEFTNSLAEIQPAGGYCVVMHPSNVPLVVESKSFQVAETHFLYVHRNLTRAISVLRRT